MSPSDPAFCMHIWVKMPPTPYRGQSLWLVIYSMCEGVALPGWGCKRLRLPAPVHLSTLSDDLFLGSMWITPLLLFSHSAMSNSSQPHDCSTPGFSVLHYLLELAQTHVHCVDDTIQPSHPLSPPFSLALKFSQHQGLFQWVGSSHQVAKALEYHLQHQSFQWIFRVDFL